MADKMKVVVMLVAMAGVRFSYPIGQHVRCTKEQAERWIAAGEAIEKKDLPDPVVVDHPQTPPAMSDEKLIKEIGKLKAPDDYLRSGKPDRDKLCEKCKASITQVQLDRCFDLYLIEQKSKKKAPEPEGEVVTE